MYQVQPGSCLTNFKLKLLEKEEEKTFRWRDKCADSSTYTKDPTVTPQPHRKPEPQPEHTQSAQIIAIWKELPTN